MGFTVVPVTSIFPTTGFSLPDLVSLCVDDDGAGGTILLNGGGFNGSPSGAVDLPTLFTGAGVLFNSIPLMRAFRKLSPTANLTAAMTQLVKNLDVNINPVGPTANEVPSVQVSWTNSGTNFPFLQLDRPLQIDPGPHVVWRVDLRLRHSIAE